MYTVSQVARAVDYSVSQVRKLTDEFSGHLSEHANTPKGQTRYYTDDDVAVLQTVAIMRAQLVSYEDIHERLDAGERLEPAPGSKPETPTEEPTKEPTEEPANTALVTESFAQALRSYDKQVSTLQQRVDELTDKLMEARERAVAAETELRILREHEGEKNAVAGETGDEARRWWQFWK